MTKFLAADKISHVSQRFHDCIYHNNHGENERSRVRHHPGGLTVSGAADAAKRTRCTVMKSIRGIKRLNADKNPGSGVFCCVKMKGKLRGGKRDLPVIVNKEILHFYPQEKGQRKKIIDGREALAMLPLVDCLRVLKAEIFLNVADCEAGIFAVLLNVAACSLQINNRES